jgi:hypothetical protein
MQIKSELSVLFNLFRAILEQFVLLGALIAGLICWVTFDNVYVATSVFMLICMLFWAIPSLIKRQTK